MDVISAHYQIILMGDYVDHIKDIQSRLEDKFKTLGIGEGNFSLLDESGITERNYDYPAVGVFFAYSGARGNDHKFLDSLLEESSIIIPCANSVKGISQLVPESIKHINALEISEVAPSYERLISLILESFQLLRSQRRLFISYKRNDAETAAIQLYEKLDSLGFDVFLDSRSVSPSDNFQETLWHRLVDSDVMILLDTPRFWDSHWTQWEYGEANTSRVSILRLTWPGVRADLEQAMGKQIELSESDFLNQKHESPDDKFSPDLLARIGEDVESIRAMALADRHRYIVDTFCDKMKSLGCDVSLQKERYVKVETPLKSKLAVVPALGVPTSDILEDIENAIEKDTYSAVWLLYDNTGVRDRWRNHINWLNDQLRVKTVGLFDNHEALLEISE